MIATGKEHVEKKDEIWCGERVFWCQYITLIVELMSVYHPFCLDKRTYEDKGTENDGKAMH